MDPNIMKLLEDDEDDTMHSGADVEAFTAALNRDIEGDNNNTSASQSSNSDAGVLPHGSNPASDQLFSQWKNSGQEGNISHIKQEEQDNSQPVEQRSSEMQFRQHGSGSESQMQELGYPHDQNKTALQQKDNQHQQQAENNSLHFSQNAGAQVSEQKITNFPEQDRMRHPDNQQHSFNLQNMNNQQGSTSDTTNNPMTRNKQVPFGLLLPVIVPHLDKDRSMQLQTLYSKLRKNEITKDGFIRLMRNIVGDQMLRQAVNKIQMQQGQDKLQATRNPQTGSQHLLAQSQSSLQSQQPVKMPSLSASQLTDSHSFSPLHQKGHRVPTDPAQVSQMPNDSSFPTGEINGQKSREAEQLSGSQGMHVSQVSSSNMGTVNQERELSQIQSRGINKQQHLSLPQTSYPMYGATISNYHAHAYSGPSISASATSLKSQTQDSQMRQTSLHQGMLSTQSGTTQHMNMMNVQKYEMQNSTNDPKRLHGAYSHLTHPMLQLNPGAWQTSMSKEQMPSMPYVKQEPVDQTPEQQHKSQFPASSTSSSFSSGLADQGNPASRGANSVSGAMATPSDPVLPVRPQVPSATASLGPGNNMKTTPKKPSIGQKKPLDALGTPPSTASKKQKVSGAFLDQSIDQLNDVTLVSGVNLREEEEQLLSGPKEDSRASEATRRVVQEEEERLILQKIPLQKKLAKIMSKFGIKNIGNDVERCLSLCVEERMRGLISNLIRASKQRVDSEKGRNRIVITSDVRRQISSMNRKAKEDLDKKQAEEAERLRKLNEADGNTAADGEKDKDEGRTKTLKANKEEDDKMRTTAANVAARVAVGGDDMLSKWQLMAEQARQKREGGMDTSSSGQSGKDVSRRTSSTSGRSTRDGQDGEKGSSTSAASGVQRKFGRNAVMAQTKTRTVGVKDMIAVLERDPYMSKSTLLYRLFERVPENVAE